MTNLKAELDKVLSRYHKNSLDSIAAIKHLLDLAEEFQNDDQRKDGGYQVSGIPASGEHGKQRNRQKRGDDQE